MSGTLFRGDYFGVFAGANGYYVAAMAADGVSHYQPSGGGQGWSEATRRRCNEEASEAESEALIASDDDSACTIV